MSRKSLTFLVAPIIALLFSIDAYAATVVYEQAPNTSYFAQSAVLNDPGDPGFNWTYDGDRQTWEYFSVASNVSFNRIGWYGTNADGDFAVDLFSATCFSCGATQVNGGGTFSHTATAYSSTTLLPNPGPFSQAEIHKTLVAGSRYSYYIDLTSNVTLDHTKTYALSVVNNYSSSPFGWALSNTSGRRVDYVAGLSMFLPGPGDMAFTLTDTTPPPPAPPLPPPHPITPVPEPETYAMLLAGLGLLGFAARRRNGVSKQAA